jgi:hypothetical protein
LHLSPTVGYVAAGFVVVVTVIQYIAGLLKRLMGAAAS